MNRYITGREYRLIPLFMMWAAAAAAPALAAEDGAQTIEEVIVTATRRETEVMETPFSMQAFTSEQLEQENIFHTRDLYEYLPSITIQEENAATDHTVQMRGSGLSSVGPDDGMGAVGYYVDDIPFVQVNSQVAPSIDYFDVQRIEVLRGPQGTSFGQDATGGSIRIYTNEPSLDTFGFKARGHVSDVKGNPGTGWQAAGVVDIPIVQGKFGIRASASHSYDPGWGTVDTRPDIDNPSQVDLTSWRVKARWKPADAWDITLSHMGWETEIDWFRSATTQSSDNGELVLNPLTNRVALARFPDGVPDNTHKIRWSSLVVDYDLGFANLTSATGYLDAPVRQFNWGDSPFGVGILFDVPVETFTQEFRMVSTSEGPLQWIGGFYYHDAKDDTIGIVDLDFGAFDQTYVSYTPRESESWSIYGEVSYEFAEQWVLLFGLRYQEDDRTADNIQENRDPLVDPIGGSTGGVPELGMWSGPRVVDNEDSFTYDNWHPRVNLTYYPTDNGMFYMNVATAFRAPVFLRGQQQVDLELAGLGDLEATDGLEVTTAEVGSKWTLADGVFRVQGAIAYSDFKNVPISISFEFDETGDGEIDRTSSAPISGADAEVWTVEWQADWNVTDQLMVGYVGSWNDGEITDDVAGTENITAFPPALTKGGDIPNLSRWTHSARVRYEAPLFNSGWQFFGSANFSVRSKPKAVFTTQEELVPAEAAWESLTMTLGATNGPWTIDLSGRNLTDFDEPYTPGSSQTNTGQIPRPRSVQLQVTFDGFQM
jgi:iron complex outermembrane receptor protein